MTRDLLDEELTNAMQVCSNVSRDAKAAGDLPTMYAANRAWHELHSARDERDQRKRTLKTAQR